MALLLLIKGMKYPFELLSMMETISQRRHRPKLVANTAPTEPGVIFKPGEWFYDSSATSESALMCALSPGSTDVDGDTLTTTYDWKINGSAVVPTTSDRLVETEFAPEDEVACTVTVSDGTDSVSVTEIDIYDDPIDNGWIQYPCTTTVSKGSRVTFYGRVCMSLASPIRVERKISRASVSI